MLKRIQILGTDSQLKSNEAVKSVIEAVYLGEWKVSSLYVNLLESPGIRAYGFRIFLKFLGYPFRYKFSTSIISLERVSCLISNLYSLKLFSKQTKTSAYLAKDPPMVRTSTNG